MGNQICSNTRSPSNIDDGSHTSSNQMKSNIHVQQAGLQAELQAAYQESECIKRKLKLQDSEMVTFRAKMSAREDEWDTKLRKC